MKCPYCDNEFKLTWKRYFGGFNEVFAIHRCPSCQIKSMLSHTWKYYFSLLWGPALVTGLIIFSFAELSILILKSPWGGFAIGGPLSLILTIIIDKWNDQKFRQLKKYGSKDRYKLWLQVVLLTSAFIFTGAAIFYATLVDSSSKVEVELSKPKNN